MCYSYAEKTKKLLAELHQNVKLLPVWDRLFHKQALLLIHTLMLMAYTCLHVLLSALAMRTCLDSSLVTAAVLRFCLDRLLWNRLRHRIKVKMGFFVTNLIHAGKILNPQ